MPLAPLQTKHSSNRNIHVVSHNRTGGLILAPSPFGRNATIVSLATMPILLYLCHHFGLDKGLWITAVLFPIFTAGGFLIGHVGYAKFGTRVILNSKHRKITISGFRHKDVPEIPFDDVVAVQRLYAGVKGGGEAGSWHAYQINIVLSDQSRYNLLESAGREQLDKIGEALSQYIGVPFKKYDKDTGK